MKLDVSLGGILLGVAGCSVAVCAYKFYSTKKNEQTSSKNEVTNTSDQKQNISSIRDKKGHGLSTSSSKEKVLSSNEPSFDENKQKFEPFEADNVNNFEENDTTKLMSFDVPDGSSMNMDVVDDETVNQEPKFSATKNEQTCSNIEINISNDANRNNSVESNVKVHVKSAFISNERLPSEVKLSLDENKVKFECLEVGNNINENAESSLRSTSIISDVNLNEAEKLNQANGVDFVNPLDVSSKNDKNSNKTKNTAGTKRKKKKKRKKKTKEARHQSPKNEADKSGNTDKNDLVENSKIEEISDGKANELDWSSEKENIESTLISKQKVPSTVVSSVDEKTLLSEKVKRRVEKVVRLVENQYDNEIETKEANLDGGQNNESDVTKSGITEKDNPVENLLYDAVNFENLLPLVEKLQNELGEVLKEFKDKPSSFSNFSNFSSFINKRIRQLEEASKETLVEELCKPEIKELFHLYVSTPENHLEKIEYFHYFYGTLVDALQKLVNIKSQLERNICEDTEIKDLGKSVRELVRCVGDKISTRHQVLLREIFNYFERLEKYAARIN